MQPINNQFSRGRLQLARSFNGITQTELAERVGVGQPFIGLIETGRKTPSDSLVSALAAALGVEPMFFYQAVMDEYRPHEWSFRRHVTVPSATIHRLVAHGTFAAMLADYLDTVLDLPSDTIPTVPVPTSRENIELAAERCRFQWGLGKDLPLTNTIRTIERAGVVVSEAQIDSDKIDGFSKSYGRRSVVVLGTDKRIPARRRFDTSHETGHLSMHVGHETGTPEREDEANYFASAFLLPRIGFRREFPRPPWSKWGPAYWRELFDMKRRWGVSVSAIIRRAFDLDMIDAAQYQRAYKYMSAKGWPKDGEPPATEPPMETPELLPNALKLLETKMGITPLDICKRINWLPQTMSIVAGIKIEPPIEKGADIIPISFARQQALRFHEVKPERRKEDT